MFFEKDAYGNKSFYRDREKKILHRIGAPAVELSNGTKYFYNFGKLHSTIGPSIQFNTGGRHWYIEGRLHNTNGPAMTQADGFKAWYINGVRHRMEGPAIILPNGQEMFYLYGEKFEEEAFKKAVTVLKEKFSVTDKLGNVRWFKDQSHSIVHRTDGPAVHFADGDFFWYKNNNLHRDDGPAVDCNEYKAWYYENDLHREDGPAVSDADGDEYWLYGIQMSKEDFDTVDGEPKSRIIVPTDNEIKAYSQSKSYSSTVDARPIISTPTQMNDLGEPECRAKSPRSVSA